MSDLVTMAQGQIQSFEFIRMNHWEIEGLEKLEPKRAALFAQSFLVHPDKTLTMSFLEYTEFTVLKILEEFDGDKLFIRLYDNKGTLIKRVIFEGIEKKFVAPDFGSYNSSEPLMWTAVFSFEGISYED